MSPNRPTRGNAVNNSPIRRKIERKPARPPVVILKVAIIAVSCDHNTAFRDVTRHRSTGEETDGAIILGATCFASSLYRNADQRVERGELLTLVQERGNGFI